jgi:hypothetical protein
MTFLSNSLQQIMKIPNALRDANFRRFSFLGDSGNRGLHFFIPQGLGNLGPIPRGPREIFEELDTLK